MENTMQKTAKRILVVGSSNTDMVIHSQHLPRPGETVIGGTFIMNPGGKGANQAVACARLGGKVTFICKIGNDIFGNQSLKLFKEECIDTSFVFLDAAAPSGIALICVDEKAENCISVASGANGVLLPADIKVAESAFNQCDIVLTQLETPLETVEYTLKLAKEKNKFTILNPAPAPNYPLSSDFLKHIDLITPNETEAEMISGIPVTDEKSAKQAAKKMCDMGVKKVIITMGSKGAFIYEKDKGILISTYLVKAIDTTAAGDCFNAGVAIAISEGMEMSDAIRFGNKAAAISVTREGAQSSLPYRTEVEAFNI